MKSLIRSALAQGKGPIARSSIHSIVIRVAGLAISFAQAVLAARVLGAQGFGIASIAVAAAQIGATLAAAGYGSLAVRELARLGAGRHDDQIAGFMRSSAATVSWLSLLAGGALSLLALTSLVPDSYRLALLLGGLLVPPLALLQLQRGVAQGLGRIVAAQLPGELLRPVLAALILVAVAVIQIPLSPHAYVAALVMTALVAIGIAVPLATHGTHFWRNVTVDGVQARRWRTESMPFLAIALSGILLGEINTLLLGWLSTAREAGIFQPVARLAPVMVLPVQAAGMRFAPRIAELWERGDLLQIDRLRRTFTRWTLALTVLIALPLAAAGPWILAFFGREFAGSAALLWIVAAAQVFNAACGPVGMLLTMRGRSRAALGGQIAGLAASCALGLWLIPGHGALGAAIAMAGGIVGWNLVMLMQLGSASGGNR